MVPDIGRVTLLLRQILTVTLVVALVTMCVPIPANASGEQEQPAARNSVLTLNGQPIRQFVSTTAHSRDTFLFSGLTQVQPSSNGQISGVAQDENGQALADHAVQPKRVFTLGGLPARQVVARTTTNAEGQFWFTGLSPGTFEVEVVVGDEVITTLGELSEGAMVVSGVTFTVSQPPERTGMSRGAKIAIGAGIGVGIFVIAMALACGTEGGGICPTG